MLTEFNDITYYINKWNIKFFWLSPCFSSTHLCGTRAAAAATDDLSNTTLVIHCCKISSSCLIVICLTLQKLPFLWLTWFFEKSFFHEGVILKSNQIKLFISRKKNDCHFKTNWPSDLRLVSNLNWQDTVCMSVESRSTQLKMQSNFKMMYFAQKKKIYRF